MDEADEVVKYQNNLESKRGSDFVLDYIQLLYYKCHKINLNCGGSLDSPNCIENKKATINSNNKKDKCFSIHCNSRIKLWRNKKRPTKNN